MLVRQTQAQKWSRTRSNFPQTQGPVARWEFRTSLRFCAPEGFCLLQGVTPVMGDRGKAVLWARSARRPRPPAILWLLSHRWESNPPRRAELSRRPQAAKSPCKKRNRSIIAPSSVWPDGQPPSPPGGRLLGSRPPGGRLERDGEIPPISQYKNTCARKMRAALVK